MKQIYYKQNEKFEYEFFKDKECNKEFEFKENENHLYLELRDGNITPIIKLHDTIETNKNTETLNVFCIGVNSELALHFGKYICGADELNSQGCGIEPSEVQYYFLDLPNYDEIFSGYAFDSFHNITPHYSKYIPEDCEVVFLNKGEDKWYYETTGDYGRLIDDDFTLGLLRINTKKIIIFTKELTSANIKQINDTAKVLKENFDIEWVGVFAELCFADVGTLERDDDEILCYVTKEKPNTAIYLENLDKLITTNATAGLFEPLEGEHLKVIDCKEIFEEYIKTNE